MILDGALVPRPMGLADPAAPFVCRRGHRFHPRATILDGTGAVECDAIRGPSHAACDSAVLVIEGSTTATFRAALSIEEYQELRRLRWRTAQILAYLGAEFPSAA